MYGQKHGHTNIQKKNLQKKKKNKKEFCYKKKTSVIKYCINHIVVLGLKFHLFPVNDTNWKFPLSQKPLVHFLRFKKK